MKHFQHYTKHKTTHPPLVNPFFSKRNWWRIGLITVAAVLIEPFVVYKNKPGAFSWEYYLQLTQYFILILTPFVIFLIWINWRESIKKKRGFVWIGNFEVLQKISSFLFYYLELSPGENNRLRVDRKLFDKIKVGDFIQIKRDALGDLEEIQKISSLSKRLSKVSPKKG